MKKTLEIKDTEKIYLVVKAEAYEGNWPLFVFKTKQEAEKFIDKCQRLFKSNKYSEVIVGDKRINKYDAKDLKVREIPFINR